jgi:hypothetical protein
VACKKVETYLPTYLPSVWEVAKFESWPREKRVFFVAERTITEKNGRTVMSNYIISCFVLQLFSSSLTLLFSATQSELLTALQTTS